MLAVRAPVVRREDEKRALNDDEIVLLLARADASRLHVPIRVTLATGVREGELLGLRWEDVDLDAGTVTVRRKARYFTGQGVVFSQPKTKNSRRTIELAPTAVRLLREH